MYDTKAGLILITAVRVIVAVLVMYGNNQVLIITINSCYTDHHGTSYRSSAGDV